MKLPQKVKYFLIAVCSLIIATGIIQYENRKMDLVITDNTIYTPIHTISKPWHREPININTADAKLLTTIDQIGEATAEKIIEYRNTHGNFTSIEQIKNVRGIGDKKYEHIKENICVE